MRVMLLVMDEQRVLLDRLYDIVRQHCDECVIQRLSKAQQMNLGAFLASVHHQDFDRVVIFSRVKRLARQRRVLQCVPGLVFLEHDAYQNYMPDSKYQHTYSRLYSQLPACRALLSGAVVVQRMQAEGIDAVFVSKGYDEQMLHDLGRERDIPVGFLGSLKSKEYAQRKALLESLASKTGMLVTRTQSGDEYLQTLNRIKVFVSADIGMGEFMIKNFEAMACGCVLLAWSQGEEDHLLGFEDMHNVVFYRSEAEALEKLALLQSDPLLAERIAANGEAFAREHYSFARVGRDLATAIQAPMRAWQAPGWLTRQWVRWRYGLQVPGQ
ncbi:glycosyltransferase [Pseudomonas sp. MWU16-30317]|uniref:glycosyltransferase family protein n=1 Tax=Pseudomonas sp. MWU16-30317 TaxID=2878095 RepID=UPI001CFAD24E|nr:glycosyltransferase [Pseudomonas sp. MWU16-30317]